MESKDSMPLAPGQRLERDFHNTPRLLGENSLRQRLLVNGLRVLRLRCRSPRTTTSLRMTEGGEI